MRKWIGAIAFTAVLGIGSAALVSPVLAADNPSLLLFQEQSQQTPVMFKDDVFVKTNNDIHSAVDQQMKKYTEGVQIGTTPEGLAKVRVGDAVVYVPVSGIASAAGEIQALRNEKAEAEKAEAEAREKKEQDEKEQDQHNQPEEEAEDASKEEAVLEIEDETEPEEAVEVVDESALALQEALNYIYEGPVLSASAGTIQGPSGKETYYNLPMEGVVNIMRNMGNTDPYWVRSDGVKMLGDYVIVAANLDLRPRGSLVPTSLGMGIVCDTGGFAHGNPTQVDIATAW